jgi:hypothetical protein
MTREMRCQQELPRPPEPRDAARSSAVFPPAYAFYRRPITMNLSACRVNPSTLLALICLVLFIGHTTASLGDHLPDFKECVQVSFPRVKETMHLAKNHRSVKQKTARAATRCCVRLPIFFASSIFPTDLIQLCTTASYYGLARPSATILVNMSLLTSESRVTPQC